MTKYLLISILTVGLLSSCASLKTTYNLDSTLDFSKYKSYSYLGWDSASTNISQYHRREIEGAFVDEFAARGLKFDPSGNGDLMVTLFLMIDVESGVRTYNNYYSHSPYGYYPSWGWGYGYGAPYGTPYAYGGVVYEEYNYVTGTLVCDIWDASTKTLAWQAVASKSIDPSEKGRNIPRVINEIMINFPIQRLDRKK